MKEYSTCLKGKEALTCIVNIFLELVRLLWIEKKNFSYWKLFCDYLQWNISLFSKSFLIRKIRVILRSKIHKSNFRTTYSQARLFVLRTHYTNVQNLLPQNFILNYNPASYYQHIFRRWILIKMRFGKMKSFYFPKLLFLDHSLQFSQIWIFSVFLPKNLIVRLEKTIWRKILIPTHSTAKNQHQQFGKTSKVSRKTQLIQQNPNFEDFEKSYFLSRFLWSIC